MAQMDLSPAQREVFYQAVWKIVRLVPKGKVIAYGQVAGYIPTPPGVLLEDYAAFKARWVGNAMAACPKDVPWQRVINAQGKISLRDGSNKQRTLLEAEGVEFDARDRIDLKRFGWDGPPAEWLRENGLVAPDAEQPSLF